MPAPAIGGAVASIGGSLLSGGAKKRAAKRAAAALQQGNEQGRVAMTDAIRDATAARLGSLADASGRVDAATAARLAGLTGARGNIETATGARVAGVDAAIGDEMAGIERIRGLLNPYVSAGQQGLSGMLALMGLNGAAAQTQAIAGVKGGAQFSELARQQEEALLANAAATGGLRGGRTQDALASSRVNLLQGLIDRQMQGFGGLATLGGNAASGLSGFEQGTTRALAGLRTDRGDALAQGQLALGQNAMAYGDTAANGQLTLADLSRLYGEASAQGRLGIGQVQSDAYLNQGSIAAGQQQAVGAANAGIFGGIAQGVGSVFGNMAPVGVGQGFAATPSFGGRFGNFGFS